MPGTSGSYTSSRHGVIYRYEAQWEVIGKTISWRARVFRNGEPIQDVQGELRVDPQIDEATAVRNQIEKWIDRIRTTKRPGA